MCPAAPATVLTPGNAGVPNLETALPAGGYATGGTPQTVSFTGTNALGEVRFTGTLTFAVYRETATGFLDFLFQVHNNSTSREGIEFVSNTDYSHNFTDVTYLQRASTGFVAGSRAPILADRSTDGAIVNFDFLGSNAISPNRTSRELVIHTHAPNFAPGTTHLIDGGVATVVSVGPRPGPEPASIVLFGGCFAGIASWGAWQRKTKLAP
jgi:hypothetical protein